MAAPDHASLVEQVKRLERTDPEANRQWEHFADSRGDSRDPAFHDAAALQEFLSSYHGTVHPPTASAAADPEHVRLVQQIKDMERTGPDAQRKWTSYCDRDGGGTYDPALHSVAFMQGFLESYDSIVTGFQPGAPAPIDEEHAHLIEEVKQLERSDPAAQQKWTSYADTQGGGSRDPARHGKAFLRAFLQLQGQVADHRELKAAMAGTEPADVAQHAAAGAPSAGAAAAATATPAVAPPVAPPAVAQPAVAPPAVAAPAVTPPAVAAPDHARLVEQVKQLERTDPEANRQWERFADSRGGSRDPSFHDAAALHEFLSSFHGAARPPTAAAAADPEHVRLVKQIKDMERTDPVAQRKWTSYCDRDGGGTYDPALHSIAFMQGFLESYDSIVTGFQPGAPAPVDEEHAHLIEEVKQLERTDPAAQQKWTSYADTQGGGSRDPARHGKAFLRAFLQLQGQVADHRELKAAMAGTEPADVAQHAAAAGGA